MSETKPVHKYKPGTTFVFFGAMLALIGGGGLGTTGNNVAPILLVAGLVLLVIGIAKKSERPTPPSS